MIVSASRRTDIPAFYPEWLIRRIRVGFAMTRNPFNPNQVRRVSLKAEDVECMVFWTRNPAPLFPYLDEISAHGLPYYVHMTITGYPRALEGNTLPTDKAISHFTTLSKTIGKERIIWRYDPILLSDLTPIDFHLDNFEKIALALRGYTDQVMISLNDFYAKTERNLRTIEGLNPVDIADQSDLRDRLLTPICRIAQDNNLHITRCCEEGDWSSLKIDQGKCIDSNLIETITGHKKTFTKDRNQRKGCGCVQSVDIGAYNSCLHDCRYCYATHHHDKALKLFNNHDRDNPFLLP